MRSGIALKGTVTSPATPDVWEGEFGGGTMLGNSLRHIEAYLWERMFYGQSFVLVVIVDTCKIR